MSDLPEGWAEESLGTAGNLRARRPAPFDGVRPYIATADVDASRVTPAQHVSFARRPARAQLMLRTLDVLQAKMRDTDKGLLVPRELDGALASSGFAQFVPSDVGNEPRFFFHLLRSANFLRTKNALCVGSTQQAISDSALAQIRTLIPPRDEQRLVAEVLSSAEEAIRETERLIEKLEWMKTGLRVDLMTRGVGDDGRLRGSSEDSGASNSTLIGEVPKSWSVVPLGDLLADGPRNGVYKSAAAIGRGALIVGQLAFTQDDSVDFTRARRAVSSTAELEIFGLKKGDLLVTRVFATRSGVGRSILVPTVPEPSLYESNMMRLRVRTTVVRPEFLFVWLKMPAARRLIEAWSYSSNQTSINQRAFKSIPCPRPPIEEQDEIVERLGAHDRAILQERDTLRKLRLLKAGLDADLLTGRVRTTVVAEAAEAVA